ncbi:DNA-directed RNA polymerase specialized sigma subunit, sigma24 family [Modestobacter sp. DSM 44400]|uniref:sigma factor-like helix-turn-helix DNA-binding protein n=1 Tax=Modestobacter sp. DSM 44400 TaxID=1550230 RepID=UPI0008986976|nr:sigma factor-like helix-turn-helix DNA-binding protein [Modestobacter sp. DSM 44400]SDX84924.1 DNA-directed RNA polymerase specialized sigma subunit, sigma24 family [Modestobacter sp. DSM 44400]
MSQDGPFSDRFVAERRPALLPTALLLTGDRTTAEVLVQATLAEGSRRWARLFHDGNPDTAVLGLLVRRATRRRGRLLRGEQVIESAPAPGDVPGTGFARSLRDLPPRIRAAVVLRRYEGLATATAAQLLDCPPATVDAETTRGLAVLRDALPAGGYEREPVDDDVRVDAELRRLAGASGRWQLTAEEAVADVRQRVRGSRRRLAGTAAAAVCVLAIGVPLAGSVPDTPVPATSAGPTSAGPTATEAGPSVPVLVGPTRGSLAGDQAFLDAVRQVGWGALEAPAPDRRDVVFAGDTPDGRVVLLVGQVEDDARGVWLTGPVGAAVGQLVPHVPPGLGRDRPLTLVLGGPGPATLVVLAARGDQVEVSDRLMTGPRGTVGRSYEAVETLDGVAVVPVRTTLGGTATSVRVLRGGEVVDRSGVDWLGAVPGRSADVPPLVPLRPVAGPPDDRLVSTAVNGLAVPLGAEPGELQPELVWAGALPGRAGGSVVIVLAHSPGGALVVGTWAGGPGVAVMCGVQTPPGAADVGGLTAARTCLVPGSRSADPTAWLVVTAPPAAATAEVLDRRGRLLATASMPLGSTVVPLPEGAGSVRTLDAAGTALTEVPVAPMATVPFGDYGTGPQR